MLQPIRLRQSKYEMSFRHNKYSLQGCTTEWDKREAARLRKAAEARALSFNKCPVDFEYLVYKFLQFLKGDEKLATGLTADSIYCHARSLIFLSADYQLCKDTLDSQLDLTDWDNELPLPRKGDDGFVEPPAKKTKFVSVREKHHRMVNFVERCLRRYILEDWSISICDNQPANQPPPTCLLKMSDKKTTIRFLFHDIGIPSSVYEQFFVEKLANRS